MVPWVHRHWQQLCRGLLRLDVAVHVDRYSISKFPDDAFRELDRFSGSVDAFDSHRDFPIRVLAPSLSREYARTVQAAHLP